MEFRLVFFRGDQPLKTAAMSNKPLLIGRSDECDITLDSRTVSRRHCELKLKPTGLTVKDLGSRNGTLVNGKAAEPSVRVVVKVGDSVQIGKFTLQIEAVGEGARRNRLMPRRDDQPDADDLLASLDEFIRKSTVLDDRIDGETMKVDLAKSTSEVQWASTKTSSEAEETASDSRSEETRLLDDPSSSGMVESTSETVSPQAETENPIDEAELRRLDLRKRLDSMKAKDSKEAANRALKKLFGG